MIFESSAAKGLKVRSKSDNVDLQTAEEYLTTGRYRVTSREQVGKTWYVKVQRLGPAESVKTIHTDRQGRPYYTRVQPVR